MTSGWRTRVRWSLGAVAVWGALGCSTETPETGSSAGTGGGAQAGSGVTAGSPGTTTQTGGTGSGTAGTGGADAQGGRASGGKAGEGAGGDSSGAGCDAPGLIWKTARKTWYTSYPDPNSPECIEYNGCTWAGQFAACGDKKPEAWVQAHDIVAVFPDFESLQLHDLCLKSGDKTIVVTVLDTCADSDCSGCCTQNQADNDALIDLESYTNERWGVEDGVIQWADLGPTSGSGCD
jgi:hypothetical protein